MTGRKNEEKVSEEPLFESTYNYDDHLNRLTAVLNGDGTVTKESGGSMAWAIG